MSKLCRICGGEMPEDRKGWEQGHKELYDDYYEIRFDNAKQVKRKYDV